MYNGFKLWLLSGADPGFNVEGYGPPTQALFAELNVKMKELGPVGRVYWKFLFRSANDYKNIDPYIKKRRTRSLPTLYCNIRENTQYF